MYEIGEKDEVVGTKVKNLTLINSTFTHPVYVPLYTGKKLICGLHDGYTERMFVCETLEDMQNVIDQWLGGKAIWAYWYQGEILPVAETEHSSQRIDLSDDSDLTSTLIDDAYPNGSQEVRTEISRYAQGNPGVGIALAKLAVQLRWTSAKQVRNWVGWPLSDHTPDMVEKIWDRLK